jgi:hypothetical protein
MKHMDFVMKGGHVYKLRGVQPATP